MEIWAFDVEKKDYNNMSPTLGNLIARAAAAAGGGGGGHGAAAAGGGHGGQGRTDPKLKAQFEWKNIDFSCVSSSSPPSPHH